MDKKNVFRNHVNKACIKCEINDEKTVSILKSKAKLLGVSKEDADAIIKEVVEVYENLKKLINDMANDSSLTNDDIQEIKSICHDIGIDENDLMELIKNLKYRIEETILIKEKNEELSDDDNGLYLSSNFGEITILYPSKIIQCRNVLLFVENIQKEYMKFSELLVSVKDWNKLNYNDLYSFYNESVEKFEINYYDYLLKQKLTTGNGASKEQFIKSISIKELLDEFIDFIEQIMNNKENIVDKFANTEKNSYFGNSVAYGNISEMITYNIGTSILNGISNSIKNANFKSQINKKVYEMIKSAIFKFIENSISKTIESYFLIINYLFEDNIRDEIENIINNKEKAKSIIENFKIVKEQNTVENNIDLVKNAIKLYPFFAEEYIKLIDLYYFKYNIINLDICKFAKGILIGLEEESILSEKYYDSIKKTYVNKLNLFNNNKCSIDELNKFRNEYNFNDDSVISELEYSTLGRIISRVDFEAVDVKIKNDMQRKFLNTNVGESFKDVRKKLDGFQQLYRIYNYDPYYEIDLYGTIITKINVEDFNLEEKKKLLEYAYNSIKKLSLNGLEKKELIIDIRDILKLNKKYVFEKEKEFFGNRISSNQEDEFWIEKKDSIEKIYDLFIIGNDYPFGKHFFKYTDRKFTTGRILNDVIDNMNKDDDTPMFSCVEETLIFTPKQGFVISLKSIYSHSWEKVVLLKDIEMIDYVEEKYVDNDGNIKNTVLIKFILKDGKNRSLDCIYYLQDVDRFVLFLFKYIQCINPNVKIKDSTGRVAEMLQPIIYITQDGEKMNKLSYFNLINSSEILSNSSKYFIWKPGLNNWIRLNEFLGINNESDFVNDKIINFKDKDIYLKYENGILGPYRHNEILDVLYNKAIDVEECFVYYKGMKEWLKIKDYIDDFIKLSLE